MINDASLPPNQQEDRNATAQIVFYMTAKDRPKRMQSRAVKTHKYARRISGK
jgi:hypothetical protein